MFNGLELSELVKFSNELRIKILDYKKYDPETYCALKIISRTIYNSHVRKHMDSTQFCVLTAMLSLQAAEICLQERATIETKKMNAQKPS